MDPSKDLLSRINRDALLQIVSSIAAEPGCQYDSDKPMVTCGYVIFVICFPQSGRRWGARFPFDQEFPFSSFAIEPLQYVARAFPDLPVPRVHGFCEPGQDSPVGAAYMLLDWIDGSPLNPWDLDTPEVAIRRKILDQLADFVLEMVLKEASEGILYYGVPDGTPSNTAISTSAWLTESVDQGLRRSLRQKNPDAAINYLIQRSMIPRYVAQEYNDSAWVVLHGDLHSGNIIVDKDFNIRGVIDWDFTFAAPLQKAVAFPKLIENVPGAAPPDIPEQLAYLDFSADKSYFLRILAAKETEKRESTSIAKLMGDSSERNFFEMSLHRAPVHKKFIEKFCTRSLQNVRAAMGQLENFLATYPNFKTEVGDAVDETTRMLTISESESLERHSTGGFLAQN